MDNAHGIHCRGEKALLQLRDWGGMKIFRNVMNWNMTTTAGVCERGF